MTAGRLPDDYRTTYPFLLSVTREQTNTQQHGVALPTPQQTHF